MQYFVSSLTNSSMSLANNLQLVTKVYFPRVLLPLAAVIVPMIDLIVGLPVLVAVMWIYESWPGGWEILLAPAFLALALVTALGAGFFLSALNVRYRDVRYMIPVLLPVLPLVSGVIYEVNELPDEVAMGALPQPHDDSHQRLAVERGRRGPAGPGAVGRRRRRRADDVLRRAHRVPHDRAEVRGHDLMPDAIAVEGLSKRYRIGELQAAYGTLRESMTHAAKPADRKGAPRGARGDLGAEGRLVHPRGGEGARRHRAQRRRQVDAAQGADAHHDPDARAARRSAAAWAACSRSARASTRS